MRSSFSPSASYNPSVNESHRNLVTETNGDDEIDDDHDGDGADAMSLEDQRRGALQETEDNLDPDFGKPYFQTRRGKLTLAVVVIVLIVIGAIVAIVMTRGSSSSASKAVPTATPAPYSPRPSKLCGTFPCAFC